MVKLDFNQDYYADLEVGPSAGIEDIRRSYRKLALKYHPDRNPGSEIQAGQRFQIIQAAYEVLTNAEQKQRYDNSRRTRYGGASGVRGNPYQDISKNYPTPPRPPGFPTRTAPKRAPPTSAADTYAKFAKDVPASSPRNNRKPAEPTFTWQAWEQMKSGAKGKTTSSQATGSGTSAKASSAPKPTPSTAPPPVPPRSPQKQAKGSFGSRVNRGYTPQSPIGDEPPVASNNYFTTRTHTNLFNETPTAAQARPQDPPNPEPTADPDPTTEAHDSTYVDTRKRTPYRTPGGEKLDPFQGANINRSRSTRESTTGPYHDEDGDSPTTSSRQRSASNPDDPELGPKAKQGGKAAFTGGNDAGAAPNGTKSTSESQNRNHQGSPDVGGHSTMPNTPPGANASGSAGSNDRDNSKLYASQPHFRFQFPIHEVPQTAPQATGRAENEKIFNKTLNLAPELHELLARQSSSEDKATFNSGLNAFDHKMHNVLSQLSAKKYSTLYGKSMQPGGTQNAAHNQGVPQQTSNADKKNPYSFDFQYADHSFTPDPHRFTRNSADNINTRFVADESDATNWQFNAGSPVSEASRPAMPRSKSGSRIGRKSPFHAQAPQVPPTEPASGSVPPQNSSFNPEEWSEKIGPQIFQTPGQTPKGNTIRPIRNPSKKPKPVRMTAGTAGMVESDENSSGQEDIPKKPPTPADANDLDGIASPNAMDIDNPLEANGVRNIHVEPSRPEWRAGDVKGIKADAKPAADSQTGTVPPVGGSEDSEEFRATFSDLRNVEPFAQPSTGLESFGDLKSNLPFTSGAAGEVPIPKSTKKPVKLDLPEAPKPPNAPPPIAVQGLKPSAASWKKYVDDFYKYLTEWHAYSTKFSDHFHARNVEVQKKLTNPGWVESRDGAGIQEYLRWSEEDRQVRAKWSEACDGHELHVRVFAAHRDRMMK
ncbi:Chaperone protein DnaJ [Cytospora mali]|uniref:Chaperone protein DnaJ n=1 Tax=Cytospora mali TaxID=578113 RepID=A0A194V8Z5_CYTMA|nr:Chaperone protein DnaJ [Valsa mali var. pyri (nom. inval.)]